MAHRISFFTYSEWDSDRDCMAFIALVDGMRARCLIRSEALNELAQDSTCSPILTFSAHRNAVQELARELIQNERMDGRELVIRLSDVQEFRAASQAVTTDDQAVSVVETEAKPATVLDGQPIGMSDDTRHSLWQSLCDLQRKACSETSLNASEALMARALNEVGDFEGQATPATAHEMNLRRVEATRMKASWKAERQAGGVN